MTKKTKITPSMRRTRSAICKIEDPQLRSEVAEDASVYYDRKMHPSDYRAPPRRWWSRPRTRR